MKVLVVYDSVFGNTEQVAFAIGKSLGPKADVQTCKVDGIRPEALKDVQLLIAGSPTRGFRPTKPMSGFLSGIPPGSLKGVGVMAFDTRISTADVKSRVLNVMVRLFGYAAKPMADALVRKGGTLLVAPEGFIVKGSAGPMGDGELERAVEWIKAAVG